MGTIWDKYKRFKKETKGIREGLKDTQKIARDLNKKNPFAKQIEKMKIEKMMGED